MSHAESQTRETHLSKLSLPNMYADISIVLLEASKIALPNGLCSSWFQHKWTLVSQTVVPLGIIMWLHVFSYTFFIWNLSLGLKRSYSSYILSLQFNFPLSSHPSSCCFSLHLPIFLIFLSHFTRIFKAPSAPMITFGWLRESFPLSSSPDSPNYSLLLYLSLFAKIILASLACMCVCMCS
jgi:hypothetical protein